MGQTERAVFSIHINATKEAVWRELTKTDAPQGSFYNTMLVTKGLAAGNAFQMRSTDGRVVNVVGEILEADPPRFLKQKMRFTQLDDPYCTVSYEIEDAPEGGVNFTLTVHDLPVGTKTAKGMTGSGGGDFICKALKRIVETGRLSIGVRAMYGMFKVLGPVVLPKRMKVEHWPMDE